MIETIFEIIMICSFTWIIFLGILFFTKISLPEKWLSESLKVFSFYMFWMSLALFGMVLTKSPDRLLLDYPHWIEVGDYVFKTRFIVDVLGSTYAVISVALIGIIFKFSKNYLH